MSVDTTTVYYYYYYYLFRIKCSTKNTHHIPTTSVVFVGKVSEGGRDGVAVAHQRNIGHLVPYREIQ